MFKTPLKVILATVAIAGVAFLALATTVEKPLEYIRDIYIHTTQDSVGLKIQKSGTQTADFLDFYSGSNLKFAVRSNGVLDAAYGGTGSAVGIQAGTNRLSNSSLVTNTFTVAYASPPVPGVSCNVSNATPYVSSVTTSNLVIGTSQTNVILYWRVFPATQ